MGAGDRRADLVPEFRVGVQGLHAPMVVIRQGRDIELRDSPRIIEVLFRGARAVGELGVSVEIAPEQAGESLAYQQGIRAGGEPFELAPAPGLEAVDSGLVDLNLDAALRSPGPAERDFFRPGQALGQGVEDDTSRFEGARIEAEVQGGERHAKRRPAFGGRGQEHANLRRFRPDDVDSGRLRDQLANAVPVAIHRQIDGGLRLGVAIDARTRRAGAVDETQSLAGFEFPAVDPDREHALDAIVEFDPNALGYVEDLGIAGGFEGEGLGGIPIPEGGGLQEDRPSSGHAEGPGFVEDLQALGAGDGQVPRIRDEPGPPPSVRGLRGIVEIRSQALVGVDLGIPGKAHERVHELGNFVRGRDFEGRFVSGGRLFIAVAAAPREEQRDQQQKSDRDGNRTFSHG